MEDFLGKIYETIADLGLQLLIAAAILIIGKFVIKFINSFIKRVLAKKNVDAAVASFVMSLLKAALWVLVIIIALTQVGVKTTSFIAVLGAAGLAIGLALQGSLANFAAGFLIILFRPFKVDDMVDIAGTMGVIAQINLFSTELTTVDNRRIIVPNSFVMGNTVVNITAEPTRRVDFVFSVSPLCNVQTIKNIINTQIEKHELVFKEPEPFVRLSACTHSSLDFTVRIWCKTSDYWTVFFDITEQVREEFVLNGITLPIPQSEVKIIQT